MFVSFRREDLKIASRLFVTLSIYQQCISDIASTCFFWKDLTFFQLGELSFYGKKVFTIFQNVFQLFLFYQMS